MRWGAGGRGAEGSEAGGEGGGVVLGAWDETGGVSEVSGGFKESDFTAQL